MKPSAIFAADLHLRDSKPKCRIDDFIKARNKKVRWLKKLQRKYKCPVVVAGDIFHHWKNSPELLRWAIKYMPTIYAIPGQHDLPNHNLELINKSSFGVLQAAGKIIFDQEPIIFDDFELHSYPFGSDYSAWHDIDFDQDKKYVAIIHELIVPNKKQSFPGAKQFTAKEMRKILAPYDVIVSGDNHKPFKAGMHINCGSMMRTNADQEDHLPRVYLWDAKTNEIEIKMFPVDKGVISREHIEKVNARDERIAKYVDKVQENISITLNFRENVDQYLKQHKVKKSTKEILLQAMED